MNKRHIQIIFIPLVLLGIPILLITILESLKTNQQEINNIELILESEPYAYLSSSAKEYVKDIYESSGELILTEKNKQDNLPYLNPQYISYLEKSPEEQKEESIIPSATIIDYNSTSSVTSSSLPSSYDLRNVDGKNYVTPVRNQGSFGTCWAFTSTASAESYILKKNNSSYSDDSTLISERQLDYVTSNNGINDYNSEYMNFLNRGIGDGGNFYISTIAFANGVSLVNYNSFKETINYDYDPMELEEVISYQNSSYELNATINMPSMNIRKYTGSPTTTELNTRESYINEVKQNLITYGAAYSSTLMGTGNSCVYINDNNDYVIDVYNCDLNDGHAMTIIGWDDNFTYSYCADDSRHTSVTTSCTNIVSGQGVWILKNSWGSSNHPYLYLAYDSLYTYISFITDLTTSNEKTWDNNYILGTGLEITNNQIYFLYYTKLQDGEKLDKIKFISNSLNSTYTLKIYGANKNYSTDITSSTTGLITVDLASQDITLNSSSRIAIYNNNSSTFFDKISIFTTNTDTSPYLSLDSYDNNTISDKNFRLYSDTKNIPSGAKITYKLLDENNNDVSSNFTIKYNTIAENNINTLVSLSNNLETGIYHISALYNDIELASISLTYIKMSGQGLEDDPYIITTPSHLSQIKYDLDAYYALGNDLDLTIATTTTEGDFYNDGYGWIPIENFSGSLDGQNHTIKGLYSASIIKNYGYTDYNNTGKAGLFGTISNSVTIKNLNLEDFNIVCHSKCGALIAEYNTLSSTDTISLDINHISLKNGNILGTNYDTSYLSSEILVGGLIGDIETLNNVDTISLSNIYIDSLIENDSSTGKVGGLSSYLNNQSGTININNIQIINNIIGDELGYYSGTLFYEVTFKDMNIENILSTVNNPNIGSLLIKSGVYINYITNSLNISNSNLLKIDTKDIYTQSNGLSNIANIKNVNTYELGTNSSNFRNISSYSNWSNFDENWTIKTIADVPRNPVLSFVNFEYTTISDILININSKEEINLYDYISPNTSAARRISYKIADENIATIDSSGIITPKNIGATTIHVESLYDGYEKDIPLTIVDSDSYCNITYNSNGGVGSMDNQVVKFNSKTQLNPNQFTKEGYTFTGWNTKSDGSGTTYQDEELITITSSSSLNLYAIWTPLTYTITFNSNGGTGSMSNQSIAYLTATKLNKNTFIKENYQFISWNTNPQGTGKSYSDEDTINISSNLELYAIWEESYSYIINKYQVDESNNYIDMIDINTNLDTFKNNIILNDNYTIQVDTKNLNNQEVLYTGGKTKIYKNNNLIIEYTNIIRGDVNGDGKINYLDYVKVYNHIYKTKHSSSDKSLLTGFYLVAADMSNDNKINYLDYVKIYNKIKELKGGN